MCGGHEGAGVVTAVGPNTKGFKEGDHVVFSFLPACGKCRWCASGMSYLCDLGAGLLVGARFDDLESFRFHTVRRHRRSGRCAASGRSPG